MNCTPSATRKALRWKRRVEKGVTLPRKCSVCQHSQIVEINQAIVAGEALRSIAKRYGFSPSAVERHAKKHLPAALVKAKEIEEMTDADGLLLEVRNLKDKALSILETAEAAGELRTALTGIKEARGCLELQTRMLCEIDRQRREQPGRRPPATKGPTKLLIVDRTPEEQREFERVIRKIRETAEEVGLKLPEGDGDSVEALREAGLLSVEWSFEERMKLERVYEEIMEARRKRGMGGPVRL